MTGIIIDIVVILIIWFCVVSGMKKGAVRTIYELGSFLIAAIVTAFVYRPVSDFLMTLDFAEKWTRQLNEALSSGIGGAASEQMSTWPQWLQNAMSNTVYDSGNALADGITQVLVSILCIIVIYLVVQLILSLIMGILDGMMKLPGLHMVNKLTGGVLGGIKGVFIIWVIFAVVLLFASMEFFQTVNDAIQGTFVAQYFYNNNWLMKLIMGVRFW